MKSEVWLVMGKCKYTKCMNKYLVEHDVPHLMEMLCNPKAGKKLKGVNSHTVVV